MEIYSEEVLAACRNGKPCSYGICDECPNTLGTSENNEIEGENNSAVYESSKIADHNAVIPPATVLSK